MKSAWYRVAGAMLATWSLAATATSGATTPGGPPPLPDTAPDIVGKALDPETGDTVYLEHYYCADDLLTCSVYYLRPDSEVFASKRLNYGVNPKAPELTFRDYRTDRELTIAEGDADYVVDAGFDNFVRLQWQDLEGGEEVVFPFRLLDREKPLTMRAGLDDRECESGKLCLEVRLNSWLLGNLVGPIELVYDRDSQRLRRFTGISNLKTDAGRSQKVDIRYRYRDDPGAEGVPVEASSLPVVVPPGG